MLHVFTSIAIPAGPGDRFGSMPQYVRATSKFFGSPWFSSVAIQMEAPGESELTYYGQLRLIFKVSFEDEVHNRVVKDLAFLRMYEEVPTTQLSRLVECSQLIWPKTKSQISKARNKSNVGKCESYMILDVQNILRAIHVLPNFSKEGSFFINSFKF